MRSGSGRVSALRAVRAPASSSLDRGQTRARRREREGQVELDELVCGDEASYVDTVAALAQDSAKLAAVRDRLRKGCDAGPLFDGERFARDIEAMYERLWDRACEGLPPEHLKV